MSDDYIKRSDAIELIARHDDTDGTINVFSGRFVNGLISAVPPADVVEIVRCKDCRWWGYLDEKGSVRVCHAAKHEYKSKNWDIYIYRRHNGEFYCADGEKV